MLGKLQTGFFSPLRNSSGVGPFLAWFAGALAELLTSSALYWLALKAALFFLVVTVLPIVLVNLLDSLIAGVIGLVNSQITGGGVGAHVLAFTGLAAYLLHHSRLDEVFSIIMAAVALKFSLKSIPFFHF